LWHPEQSNTWQSDTWQSDTQQSNTQQCNILQNSTWSNDPWHRSIHQNDTRKSSIQQNDIRKSSIQQNDTQQNDTHSALRPSGNGASQTCLLNAILLSAAKLNVVALVWLMLNLSQPRVELYRNQVLEIFLKKIEKLFKLSTFLASGGLVRAKYLWEHEPVTYPLRYMHHITVYHFTILRLIL
jgi:hypothetical protein